MRETRDNPSDVELVRAALGGDRRAYEILVDRHVKGVYSVAMRILGHAADAEDTSQDTFLRAFERLETYDQGRCFHNWLLKIAGNLAINRIRSRRCERRLQLRLVEAGTEGSTDPTESEEVPSPHEWACWLDQIDEAQRAAIVLFHFHDLPYTEIAEVLKVPVNTVRTYLYRGRKRLRELMAPARGSENGAWTVAM